MDLVTAADLRAADAAAAERGVATATLMENAGRAAFDAVRHAWPEARRVVVLCGPGDNGGDGFVVARLAREAGLEAIVLALPPSRRATAPAADRPERRRSGGHGPSPAAAEARAAWERRGDTRPLTADALSAVLAEEHAPVGADGDEAGGAGAADESRAPRDPGATVVVDALFGSGLARPLAGAAADAVARLNEWAGPVLAIDVPSGVEADSAVPPGPHVRATRTLQLAAAVSASALPPARFAFGAWTVADIGLPAGALPAARRPRLVTDAAARGALPEPARDAHKYGAGTVTIVAGSGTYPGAGELACRGAHRGGAGLVTLITRGAHPSRWPETIVRLVPAGASLREAIAEQDAKTQTARVLGPGLEAEDVVELPAAIESHDVPTVLDAAALVPELRQAVRLHGRCWLTPHAGEAARLLGVPAEEIVEDPIEAAVTLAGAWRAGVVLKLAGAVVATPDGRARVVAGGHAGLASGGTGDVLAGLLGALLALPADDPLERVAAGVHLHARAGERAGRRYGRGLRASDVADAVPWARRSLGGSW